MLRLPVATRSLFPAAISKGGTAVTHNGNIIPFFLFFYFLSSLRTSLYLYRFIVKIFVSHLKELNVLMLATLVTFAINGL